jgi:hypothetical protein
MLTVGRSRTDICRSSCYTLLCIHKTLAEDVNRGGARYQIFISSAPRERKPHTVPVSVFFSAKRMQRERANAVSGMKNTLDFHACSAGLLFCAHALVFVERLFQCVRFPLV